jgi:hypothetical protein
MKKPWNSLLFLLLITLPFFLISAQQKTPGSFDKMGFYKDLSRNNLKLIDGQLAQVIRRYSKQSQTLATL